MPPICGIVNAAMALHVSRVSDLGTCHLISRAALTVCNRTACSRT
jgi:hypothetical protein